MTPIFYSVIHLRATQPEDILFSYSQKPQLAPNIGCITLCITLASKKSGNVNTASKKTASVLQAAAADNQPDAVGLECRWEHVSRWVKLSTCQEGWDQNTTRLPGPRRPCPCS